MTHKDFENVRYNPSYTIVVDDKSILKNSYNLDIIDSKEGELYNKSRAYCELSKLYYIFKIYKNETISSKYIGLNHYRRYFNFKDNIPHLDYIFRKYDVILNDEYDFNKGIREQYCENHICKNFDELIQIIKDIKPDYYETALHTINETEIKYNITNYYSSKKPESKKEEEKPKKEIKNNVIYGYSRTKPENKKEEKINISNNNNNKVNEKEKEMNQSHY